MTVKLDITNLDGPNNTAPAPLRAGRLGERAPVHATMLGQDSIISGGRRILFRTGLLGADAFMIPSTDPAFTPSQVYPTVEQREVAFGRFDLTPGHGLRMAALVLPSGPRQRLEAGGWVKDGAGGAIQLQTRWIHQVFDEVTTTALAPPTSQLEFNGEPQEDGGGWSALALIRTGVLRVPAVDFDDDELKRYGGTAVRVEISLIYAGGVRPVDIVIWEEPWVFGADEGSDVTWPAGCYANGDGTPLEDYPTQWPQQRKSDAPLDRTIGSLQVADVGRDHVVLGPAMVGWSSYSEGESAVDEIELAGVAVTSTTFVDLLNQGVIDWAPSNPGFSASSCAGASSIPFSWNGPLELRGENGTIPVSVRFRARVASGGSGIVRIQTHDYGWRDVTVMGVAYEYYSTTVWVRCGTGPWDPSNLQFLARVTGAGQTLEVQSLSATYGEEPV